MVSLRTEFAEKTEKEGIRKAQKGGRNRRGSKN